MDTDVCPDSRRFLTPDEVKEVAEALGKLSSSQFASRYDAPALMAAHIYPRMWYADEAEVYLLENFTKLRKFFAEAAKNDDAMLLFLAREPPIS